MKKRTKIITVTAIIILTIAALLVGGGYVLFGKQIKAISSIERLEDNLYYFEYRGDYGIDELIEQGGVSSDEALADYLLNYLSAGFMSSDSSDEAAVSGTQAAFACSTVSAENENGERVFGRNYDWEDSLGVIIKTVPDNGYASLSTCDLTFVVDDPDFVPDEDFISGMETIAGVFVPFDGINEKGLCIADLAIRGIDGTQQDNGLTDVTTTVAIRLILDHAATVDEAVELLSQYDMHSSAGMCHHFAISDATGKSVVVEYLDDEMVVTETPVVTNFVVAEGKYNGIGLSPTAKPRYDTLMQLLDETNGVLSAEAVRDALESVKDGTMWSIAYNQNDCSLDFYFRENYEKCYEFSLSGDAE